MEYWPASTCVATDRLTWQDQGREGGGRNPDLRRCEIPDDSSPASMLFGDSDSSVPFTFTDFGFRMLQAVILLICVNATPGIRIPPFELGSVPRHLARG